MFRNLKRLLGLNIIEWVDNTDQHTPHLEADKYLLVESNSVGPILLTKSQIRIARDRAIKNPEDV